MKFSEAVYFLGSVWVHLWSDDSRPWEEERLQDDQFTLLYVWAEQVEKNIFKKLHRIVLKKKK